MGAQRGPSSSTQDSRPSRGAKPREADDTTLPQARPPQAGSRGGGEIKVGYLTGAHDASHDDQRYLASIKKSVEQVERERERKRRAIELPLAVHPLAKNRPSRG